MNSPVRNSTSRKPLRGVKPHSIVTIDPDRRRSMVAEAAYYFSQHRDFAPGHELDDWLAAENQIDLAVRLGEQPTLAGPSTAPASTEDVAQQQTMTEQREREQKPWYPRLQNTPPLYNVETWQNLSEDNPMLRLDAEAEEAK